VGDPCHLDDPGQSRDDRDGLSPRFFPTVAWPSEAVRVGDDSIAFIQKLVADPFYRPRGDPFPCVPCVPWFKDEKPAMTKNRGQSPRGGGAECSPCFRRWRPNRSQNRTF
jgi:hypothetical protein